MKRNRKRVTCAAVIAGPALAALSLINLAQPASADEIPAIPIGYLDSVIAGTGSVQVAGWTIEPDTTRAIDVQIFVDGVYNQTVNASVERDDVGAAFPGFGPNHGYTAKINGLTAAAHVIDVYAINADELQNDNVLLGEQAIAAPSLTPFGSVDVVRQTTGDNVLIEGWAIDPKTSVPISVAVYVDGVGIGNTTADRSRTDVGAAYPADGSNHGFTVMAPLASAGAHTIDVYAIDSSGDGNNPLVSRTVTDVATESFGSVDVVTQTTGDNVRIEGWAIDPKTTAPISVALYVDGAPMGDATADRSRTDVGAVYPAAGDDHGFDVTVPIASIGTHTVDVYALDSSADGDNPLLRRSTVVITAPVVALP